MFSHFGSFLLNKLSIFSYWKFRKLFCLHFLLWWSFQFVSFWMTIRNILMVFGLSNENRRPESSKKMDKIKNLSKWKFVHEGWWVLQRKDHLMFIKQGCLGQCHLYYLPRKNGYDWLVLSFSPWVETILEGLQRLGTFRASNIEVDGKPDSLR